jgi:uncharacterized lipoprotein YbaY
VFAGQQLRQPKASYGSNAEVVKALQEDSNGVAICGLKCGGHALRLLHLQSNGVTIPCDDHAVLMGSYPLIRPMTIVLDVGRDDAQANANREFVRYALHQAGQSEDILSGFFPFDIAEEINNHADSSGRVQMVVLYRRSGQLRSVTAQLGNRQGALSGTLIVRNGSIPPNSIVTVQLENATRPYFAVRNGQHTFRAPSYSQGSLPFRIDYDPRYVSGTDRYVVRAYVTYNGNTIYETAQPTSVLTQGNPSTAQLVLTPKSFPFAGQPAGGVVTASYGSYDNITSRVTQAYQRYLGRSPTTMEIAAWHSVPDPEYRMNRLSIDLLATQEYFDRCGNNNVAWIERTFTEVIGHVPSSYEQQQWMARFAEVRYSRTEVLNQMALVAGRR